MLAPERVSVPEPDLVSAPLPANMALMLAALVLSIVKLEAVKMPPWMEPPELPMLTAPTVLVVELASRYNVASAPLMEMGPKPKLPFTALTRSPPVMVIPPVKVFEPLLK